MMQGITMRGLFRGKWRTGVGKAGLALALASMPLSPALADESEELAQHLQRLEAELAAQRELINRQQVQIEDQQDELNALKTSMELRNIRGTGLAQAQAENPPFQHALAGPASWRRTSQTAAC